MHVKLTQEEMLKISKLRKGEVVTYFSQAATQELGFVQSFKEEYVRKAGNFYAGWMWLFFVVIEIEGGETVERALHEVELLSDIVGDPT